MARHPVQLHGRVRVTTGPPLDSSAVSIGAVSSTALELSEATTMNKRQKWEGEKSCDNEQIDLNANTANVPAEPNRQWGRRGVLHGI